MRQPRWRRFIKKWILPNEPNWTLGRSALLRRHDESLLLLIVFQSSGFDKDVWGHIDAVVFPLYLNCDGLVLNIAQPLHRNPRKSWRLMPWEDDPDEHLVGDELLSAIQTQGIPFLQSLATLDAFSVNLPKLRSDRPRLGDFDLQALAGAEILLGRTERAIHYIRAHSQLLADENREVLIAERREWEAIAARLEHDAVEVRAELRERIVRNAEKMRAPPVCPL